MKIKETYTLEELCSGLTIPLTKFCQMAGITEPTLIRIRKGYAARQHTINLILAAFSKVYERELDLSNVSGLILQEKPHQTSKAGVVTTPVIDTIAHPEPSQNHTTEPKRAKSTRGSQRHPKKADLPEGCILYSDFAKNHQVAPTTFRDHIKIGLGPKGSLIHGPGVPEDGSVLVKDYVRTESRPKPGREYETEYYLTGDQQQAALEFWKRHRIEYHQCDTDECPCHVSAEQIK